MRISSLLGLRDFSFVEFRIPAVGIVAFHLGERLAAAMSEAQALKDTFGMSAPPYTKHRLYAEIVAQNWAPGITYEYLFSDFWSVAARFSYSYFTQKNIAKYTDVEGEMKTFSFPLIVRWYWGRRNMGTSQVIDAVGKNHEIGQMSQIECFLQMRMDPVFYSVDLVSPTDKTRLFPHSENRVLEVYGVSVLVIGSTWKHRCFQI